VFSIMFFLNQVLEPYGLKILGQLMALAGLFGLIVQPLWELGKFFTAPGRTHKMKKERIVASLAVVGAIIAFVLFVPLPFSVKCTFEVQPREAQHVFTSVPGQLTLVAAKPGQTVQAGETIVELANPDLAFEVLALDGKRQEADNMVLALRDQKHVDPAAVDQEEMAREMAEAAQKQYAAKKEELDRLTIRAPAAGTIIPPPSRSAKAASAPGQLPSWTGTPFDDKNLGALITPGDPICIVADPEDVQAVLVVDQAYVDLVKEGQPVRVLLESDTRRAYDSHVESIAAIQLEAVSRTSSTQAGGRLETKMDPSGMFKPLSTSYQAAAPLPELGGTVQVGMQGQARIYTGWQPLGRRLFRFVAKTFHFDL
jgi:putative peptide zinc metalloprotease protein